MAGQHGRSRIRAKPQGAVRGNGADGAVNNHRCSVCRRREEGAAHGGNVQAAQLRHQRYRLLLSPVDPRQCAPYDAFFPFKSRRAEPRAAPGDPVGIQVQERRGKRRRGCGVADAHLPHRQQLRPLPDQFFRQGRSLCHGGKTVFPRHGRFPADVPRAVSHPQVPHPGMSRKIQDSHVGRDHAAAGFPRHGVRRAAAFREGDGDLSRHLASALADPLGDYPVIRAEDDQCLLIKAKIRLSFQSSDSRDHVLKQAKAAQGLRHCVPACRRLIPGLLIRREDLSDHFIDCFLALHMPNMPLQIVLPEAAPRQRADAETRHTASRSPGRSASFFRPPSPP